MSKKKRAQISFREVFKKGDLAIKPSLLVIGAVNFANKQWLKGITFLTAETGFIYWLIRNGFHTLIILGTLGTQQQELIYNDSLGIEVLEEDDNSVLLLLFGIAATLVCLSLIVLYVINLKSVRYLYELKTASKKIPTTMDDLRSLLNECSYATLITVPLLGVLFFTILSLLYMISITFTNYDHNHLPPKNLFTRVGLASLGNIITGGMASTFFPVLGRTLIWAVFATATCFFFGIILALPINIKGLKYKALWRIIFAITIAVPPLVLLLVMRNLLNGSGSIDTLLLNWGLIDSFILFLTDPNWAKLTIIAVDMWIGVLVTTLISTGIIQNLPEDQTEAARIDGVNEWQISKGVTFPQILFVMTPAPIQQFIGSINNLNVIYLLTGGGPANSSFHGVDLTNPLATWLYKLTVDTVDYNPASVIGILILILSTVFNLIAHTRTNSSKEA